MFYGIRVYKSYPLHDIGLEIDVCPTVQLRNRGILLAFIYNPLMIISEWGDFMGTKGREIVDLDIKQLLEALNKAFADEWLAYYQYWIGAKVIKGPMRQDVEKELIQHASEELTHAEKLAVRIIQLGGTPIIDPKEWHNMANCPYEAPSDPFVKKIIEQNIKGEQCAIQTYNNLLKMTKDKDTTTYHIVLEILSDELEHEEDLQNLLEDFELLK